jgi:hypothetical protein
MRLYRYYSFSECSDEERVTEYLEELNYEGKIRWKMLDQWTFHLEDSDLSEFDERLLIELFDECGILPSSDFEDGDDMGTYYTPY